MVNKYGWEDNQEKVIKRSWDKRQSAWHQAEGVCKVCKEDYIRHRRLSRSSVTEYDHGTWVCVGQFYGKNNQA